MSQVSWWELKTEHAQNPLLLFSVSKKLNLAILCGSRVLTHSSWMPEADHKERSMHECNKNIEIITLPQLPYSIQSRLGDNSSSGITEFWGEWDGLHSV